MAQCPKCGGDVPKTYTNKRGQIVGTCKACGKWVNLGRTKNGGEKSNGTGAAEANDSTQETQRESGTAGGGSRDKRAPDGAGNGLDIFERFDRWVSSLFE